MNQTTLKDQKIPDTDSGSHEEFHTQYTTLNLGPTHPATHGIFQNILTMDGEIIVDAEQTTGYIHRAFEKIAERRPFYQITTLTDRLNYCSSPINNMGWHMTVEKLIQAEIPKRAQYMRVIIMELSRIADHLVCNSVIGVDTGALTGFTYVFQWREKIYEIFEGICGARLTTNIGRIGGMERDFSDDVYRKINDFLRDFPTCWNATAYSMIVPQRPARSALNVHSIMDLPDPTCGPPEWIMMCG